MNVLTRRLITASKTNHNLIRMFSTASAQKSWVSNKFNNLNFKYRLTRKFLLLGAEAKSDLP